MKSQPARIKAIAMLCLWTCLFICSGGCNKESLRYEAAGKAGWIRCASKEGGFSVAFPDRPKTGIKEQKSASGITLQFHYYLVTQDTSKGFSVLYADYPDFILKNPPSALFDIMQQAALGISGRLIYSEDETFDSYPAKFIRFQKTESGPIFEMKLILVKKRIYEVLLASKPTREVAGEGNYFFDSFKLENK